MTVTFAPNLPASIWAAQPDVLICMSTETEIMELSRDWREVLKSRDQFEALSRNHCDDCRVYGGQVTRRAPEGYHAIQLSNQNASYLLSILGIAERDENGYPELCGQINVDRLEEHILLANLMDLPAKSEATAPKVQGNWTEMGRSQEYLTERLIHLAEIIQSARLLGATEIAYS